MTPMMVRDSPRLTCGVKPSSFHALDDVFDLFQTGIGADDENHERVFQLSAAGRTGGVIGAGGRFSVLAMTGVETQLRPGRPIPAHPAHRSDPWRTRQGVDKPLIRRQHAASEMNSQGQVEAVVHRSAGTIGEVKCRGEEGTLRVSSQWQMGQLDENEVGICASDLASSHFLPEDAGDFEVEEKAGTCKSSGPVRHCRASAAWTSGTNHFTATLASTTRMLTGRGPRARGPRCR